MTFAARSRLLLLSLLCAALPLSLPAAAAAASGPTASSPAATAAKKKRGQKRRATKRDLDGDGIPNSRDRDIDGDGKPNSRDRDIDGDGKPNSRDRDMDGDGVPNARDRDMDGDGQLNIHDPDPDADGKAGIAPGVLPPPPVSVKQPRTFFGVVGGGSPRHSAALGASGAGTARLVFSWAGVELSPGRFDFSAIDAQVKATAEHGVTVLPLLFEAPGFRSSAPAQGAERGWYPPRSNADFAAFAAATVRRYGPGGSFWSAHPELPERPIRAWQVWNEPNLPVYWRPAPSAAQYVEMVRAVGTAIEGVDPEAEIVTAGVPDSRNGVPLADYLAGMYRAGGKTAFDTLATHPYATTPEGVSENLAAARELLDRHGDHGANLLATEFGWATSGPASTLNVGEHAQAALIRRTLERLAGEASRLRLRGVTYYQMADEPLTADLRDFWGLHAGLLDTSGRRKPGFQAYADAVRALTLE